MGCDRCAKRLVCLCPWRRTVEGHALTGPLRSVRTYPRPLPLQSQRAECGRRGGCSGGSVAAAPQKCPLPAPKHPPEPGFLHLSLTSIAVLGPACGGHSVPERNRLPLSRRVFPAAAAPSGPIRGGDRVAPCRWPTGYAARTGPPCPVPPGSCVSPPGIAGPSRRGRAGPAHVDKACSPGGLPTGFGDGRLIAPPPLGLDHPRGTGGVPPVDCRSTCRPPVFATLASRASR